MQAIQFAEQVKATFHKHFPNGYINISSFFDRKGACIKAGLISDIADQPHNIRDNDPMRLVLAIHENIILQDGFELGDSKLLIEIDGNSLSIKPTERHMAMGREKIPARKINNTPEKALVALDKLFAKAKEIVTTQAAANNIYGQDRIPAKYL